MYYVPINKSFYTSGKWTIIDKNKKYIPTRNGMKNSNQNL